MKILETIIYVKYKNLMRDIRYPLDESEVIDGWVYASYKMPLGKEKQMLREIVKHFRAKGFKIKEDQFPKNEKDLTVSILEV